MPALLPTAASSAGAGCLLALLRQHGLHAGQVESSPPVIDLHTNMATEGRWTRHSAALAACFQPRLVPAAWYTPAATAAGCGWCPCNRSRTALQLQGWQAGGALCPHCRQRHAHATRLTPSTHARVSELLRGLPPAGDIVDAGFAGGLLPRMQVCEARGGAGQLPSADGSWQYQRRVASGSRGVSPPPRAAASTGRRGSSAGLAAAQCRLRPQAGSLLLRAAGLFRR